MTQTLKVLSYNIHKGFSSFNRRYLLHDIRAGIRQVDADIVCLQEVIGENMRYRESHSEWIPGTQLEFIADEVWPHTAYGRNAVYSHGHHGNAILSKYRIVDTNNHDLSIMPPSQRGILVARLENGITVCSTHLGLLGREQRWQIERLRDLLDQGLCRGGPLLIAGDFNDWSARQHRRLCQELELQEAAQEVRGRLLPTFPAALPLLPLDRIYFRRCHVKAVQALKGPPWNRLSDHSAYYAEFKFDEQDVG